MKNMRQSPSGPKRVFSLEALFPGIEWSGDVNPPMPPGKIGEGQTTKASSIVVVGINELMGVLASIQVVNPIIFTFGIPFSFGYCMIEPTPVFTPQGEGRRVWLGISYLQNLGPGESFGTGGEIPIKLVFFNVDNTLQQT